MTKREIEKLIKQEIEEWKGYENSYSNVIQALNNLLKKL